MYQQRKGDFISLGRRACGTDALGCAVFDSMCYGADSLAMVEGAKEDQDPNEIDDVVAYGGATKTISGLTSVQSVTDQYEETTVETTDVGCTVAGGETEVASTKIWIPHFELSQ